MSSDEATVQFKASIDELLKGIAEAASALNAGFASVNETVKQTSASIEQQLGQAAASTSQQIQELGNQTRNTGEAVDSIAGKVNVAFAFAVVEKAKEYVMALVTAVREVGAAASDVLDTAYAFGITSKELQGFTALAAQTGTDTAALNRVMLLLQTKLLEAAQGSREAQEELATFGITSRDFNDAAFTSADALVKVAQSSTNAAEKIQLFGRNNVSVLGVLGPLEDGIGAVGNAADEAGAATRDQLEALSAFANLCNQIGNEFNNLQTRLLSATVPALTKFYEILQDVIGRAGPIRDVLAVAFKILGVTVAAVLSAVAGALQVVRGVIDAFLRLVKLVLQALSDMLAVVEQVLVGNFSEAWEKAKEGADRFKDNFTELKDGVVSDAKAAGSAISDMWKALVSPDVAGTAEEKKDGEARPNRGQARQRKQETDSVAEELKLQYDLAAQGSEKRIALANQIVERMARVYGTDSDQFRSALRQQAEAVRQFNEEQLKLAEARVQTKRDGALQELEVERARLDQEIALGNLSIEQQFQRQQELADRKLAIERAYYDQIKVLRAEDAVAQEQAQAALNEAQSERQRAGIEGMTEKLGQLRQAWETNLAPISSAFSGAIQGMIQGTETLSNAVRKMALNILLSFADLAVKKTIKWIAGEIAMTQATAVNSTARAALEDAGAKKGIISGAFAALKKIAQFAATAAAGAFQAIVGIPYVGPFLAPAAAVAAGAAVLALGRSIASAAGGWVVPSDQLAMVHKDEMILPARISSGLQSMINGNGEGGGSGGMTFSPTVMAMDGDSVRKFFQKNGRELARVMWEQAQAFNPRTAPNGGGTMMGSMP